MKEFTIKQKKTQPILTLAPKVLDAFLKARPESISLVLARTLQSYKLLTNKTLMLQHDQQEQLLARVGADASGMWTSKYSKVRSTLFYVKNAFTEGFMRRSIGGELLEDLAIVEAFYEMLDAQMEREALADEFQVTTEVAEAVLANSNTKIFMKGVPASEPGEA